MGARHPTEIDGDEVAGKVFPVKIEDAHHNSIIKSLRSAAQQRGNRTSKLVNYARLNLKKNTDTRDALIAEFEFQLASEVE